MSRHISLLTYITNGDDYNHDDDDGDNIDDDDDDYNVDDDENSYSDDGGYDDYNSDDERLMTMMIKMYEMHDTMLMLDTMVGSL